MTMKVYVLGAYGLIGSACVDQLLRNGFTVVGVGRSRRNAHKCNRKITWHFSDISKTSVNEWAELLSDADVIVNAAGALQDGARDNLDAIHVTLIENITRAIEGRDVTFIQISAAGVNENAPTEFMRSKARGDNVLRNSPLSWQIFRPTLVISRDAYGGTAILRAAAAFPFVNLQIFPKTQVQTVSIDDVANAVCSAAKGLLPPCTVTDLTEENSQSFDELKRKIRLWLGLPSWRYTLPIPNFAVWLLGLLADCAGALGWRSPLRTNALKSLENGIAGDAKTWQYHKHLSCRPLEETLSSMPATIQERWFAKLYLMLPLCIVSLSLFWLLSGIIGLYAISDAQQVLSERGMPPSLSTFLVVVGAFADIALGTLVLFRRLGRLACLGMIALSAAYLVSSLFTAPDLWLDPLGPMVKVVPSIVLVIVTLGILDER